MEIESVPWADIAIPAMLAAGLSLLIMAGMITVGRRLHRRVPPIQ